MSAHFPDQYTIQAALSLAVRAPSMQNSQPWRWQVGPHGLHLYAAGGPDLRNADPGHRALLLSCGAALNHCVVGLAAFGWQAKIHRFPDTAVSEHLATIDLHRSPAAESDVTLAAAIPRRRTDRRRYSAWPVPRGDLALMGARAARAGVTMRRIEALNNLANSTARSARSASEHAAELERLPQLATWSGRYASHAEAPAQNVLGTDPAALWPTPVIIPSALRHTPDDRLGHDNAVVVALGTTCDDAMAHLRAGEATSVVLLTATALGLASCSVTEPLQTTEDRESARQIIFEHGEFAQILLRIGWAPVNADPLPPTPRHDLADVVEWLIDDGGPS